MVLRSVHDYAHQRDRFLGWAESVPRLVNHPDVLRWITAGESHGPALVAVLALSGTLGRFDRRVAFVTIPLLIVAIVLVVRRRK